MPTEHSGRRVIIHSGAAHPGARLGPAATDIYGDPRLAPLLRRLLVHSSRLLDAVAGSISLIGPGRDRYAKVAERGASCRLGQSFPLDEGATGRVVADRRPVVLDRYGDLPAGHLPAGHPAVAGAVAAVPIWWRGEVVGANVVFAGQSRWFTAGELDELEDLTAIAASGIVRAGAGDPSLVHLGLAAGAGGTAPAPAPAGLPASPDAGPRLPPGPPGRPGEPCPCTPREQEVLGLLARGETDRGIAAALVISARTVEKHVGALLRKTGTTTRTAAVMRALERGWLPAPRPAG